MESLQAPYVLSYFTLDIGNKKLNWFETFDNQLE